MTNEPDDTDEGAETARLQVSGVGFCTPPPPETEES